jgi:hypothetical protein
MEIRYPIRTKGMSEKTIAQNRVPTLAEAVKFRGEISNLSEAIGAAIRKRERDQTEMMSPRRIARRKARKVDV